MNKHEANLSMADHYKKNLDLTLNSVSRMPRDVVKAIGIVIGNYRLIVEELREENEELRKDENDPEAGLFLTK